MSNHLMITQYKKNKNEQKYVLRNKRKYWEKWTQFGRKKNLEKKG